MQLDQYQKGLTGAVLGRNPDGSLQRRAGVMGIVVEGGAVSPGDAIRAELPALPHFPLERV
ncbi:hypothetical protein D3C77_766710 [compost metagenome]